jgi:hypothetical protein
MRNRIIAGKGSTTKSGKRGNQMWSAHSLEAVQKNAGIKPEKKKKKVRV